METVRNMQVWVKVDREQCFRENGKPPIKLRWVDISKGDETKPNHRSRIVAKEIKTDSRPDLFAPTPLIEHLEYLISRVASSQRSRSPARPMVQDVKKAYFFAEATRRMFIELPPEDSEPGRVGLLKKSRYGTRDAALNRTAAYNSVLCDKLGLVQGKSTPCALFHPRYKIRTVVHGTISCQRVRSTTMNAFLKKHCDIKTEIVGPEPECVKQLKIRNRIVTLEKSGIAWEPDPRHAEIVIDQLGLT